MSAKSPTTPLSAWPLRIFEAAYAWFARPIAREPIVAARAGLGATLCACSLQLLPYGDVLFGPQGIGGHDTLARNPGFVGLSFQAFANFRLLHHIDSLPLIVALQVLLVISSACFALGVKTRAAGLIAAGLHIVFNAHNPMLDGGGAWLIAPFILYLTLCGPERPHDGGADCGKIAPWGLRLLQVHVCTMYLVAGFERLDAKGWLDGEMVMRALINAQYGRFDVDWLAVTGPLAVISFAVWVLEPAAPVMLWLRPIGRYWALLLIGMHVGIELLTDVGWWHFLMASALLAFLPAQWLQKLPGLKPRGAASKSEGTAPG